MKNSRWFLACLAIVGVPVIAWLALSKPWKAIAPPGGMPAAPTGGQAVAPDLEGGLVVPRLSAEEAQKLKRGEPVEMKVGEGSIVIGKSPPPESTKP